MDETTHDIEKIGTLSSHKDTLMMEQIEPSSYMSQYREPETLTPPENYITGKDNVAPQRIPVVSGFLVSFLVDARGGAMNGSRYPGLRIVIPPNAASAPTRVTCRLMRQGRVTRPPQFNDGEGLACRIIEMGPINASFNGNVLLEVPHFASLRDREREIVVLRSDNGDTWKEHTVDVTEQAVLDAVGGFFSPLETNEELRKKRVIRILTNSFPQYFALVTRVRQESALIGPEGGVISSTVIGQVQAVFPEGALTKKIRVGIQALPVHSEQVGKLLGNRVAVSPVVTIEPRRRKFHKPITLTIPLPKPATRGMTSPGESPTLRLLCSITGGVQPATWEDITGSTPLSYVKDCVSFTTTVSARFWLMDCPNTAESADMAGRLYREAFLVPYMGRFVIFAKRSEADEAKLRCFCITDDKVDKTLECNEGFERKAESREVEVLDGKPQWIEGVGNLAPVAKNGDQLFLPFRAFRENRLAFPIKVKDVSEPAVGKVAFLKDPRPTKPTDSPSLKPICTLEVVLPDFQPDGSAAPKLAKRATAEDALPELLNFTTDRIARSELDLRDLAEAVRSDWPMLARELGVSQSDITNAKVNFRDDRDRAFAVLCQWQRERGQSATGNEMERALRRIGRDDVVKKCMRNVEYVEGEDEKRQAKSLLDRQEQEDRRSSSPRASGDVEAGDDDTTAGGEIVPAVDERTGPPPPEKSAEEKAHDQQAKTAAFLDLIDSMNSMTPEPEIHIPGSDVDAKDEVHEADISAVSRDPRVEDPAAVEELLDKLDSLPAQSMAPEGDEEVDAPQSAPVSHAAPPQLREQQPSPTPPPRETPPPSPVETPVGDDAADVDAHEERARKLSQGFKEREGELQEQQRQDEADEEAELQQADSAEEHQEHQEQEQAALDEELAEVHQQEQQQPEEAQLEPEQEEPVAESDEPVSPETEQPPQQQQPEQLHQADDEAGAAAADEASDQQQQQQQGKKKRRNQKKKK